MATPDLSTLTSSAQIFSSSHTIPQIRAIHKALHTAIDDKAARLRTQVGGSYRDLLGTADTIVAMRTDMDSVQATLGRMGGRCGRAVVGAKVAGLEKFSGTSVEIANAGPGVVARARLLETCALAVERIIRDGRLPERSTEIGQTEGKQSSERGDGLIIAAKVLLLSRLLEKGLGKNSSSYNISTAVDAAKKNLENLRRRLLRKIEKFMQSTSGHITRDDTLKAMTAYSLATSSGAQVVLRHFLRERGLAMAQTFELEETERSHSAKDVIRCLKLYTKTLLDVQAIAPAKLTEALGALKQDALLADQSLRAIEGLRLDVYQRWCGDEIKFFKPFIRHDDLSGEQTREMLTNWANDGSKVLLNGLGKTLDGVTEFKLIVELRTSLLKLWISEGGRAKGFDQSIMLNRIREVINKHMLLILETKVSKLHLVGSEVSATLDSWQKGQRHKHQSLWDDKSFDMDLSNGAAHFAQDVIARLYGRDDAVSKAVSSYKSWYRIIDDVTQIVEQLKRQRWDNDIDDIEDEETIEDRQRLLSKDDPQALLTHLHASLIKSLNELEQQLAALWAKHKDGSNKDHVAMYLLRILRDVRSQLPELSEVKEFGLAVVPNLHETLTAAVITSPLHEFETRALSRKSVGGRSLWEGEPQLPSSPSPGALRLLRDVSVSMSDAGMDLWSPKAVGILKQLLAKQLCRMWLEGLESHSQELPKVVDEAKQKDEEGGGDEVEKEEAAPATSEPSTAETEQQRKDIMMQWVFDIAYLRSCLGSPSSSPDELQGVEDICYKQTGLTSSPAREQLAKAARDYWKRTSLLFGLLSG